MTSGKNGFTISETIIPSVRLSRDARWRACALGKYPRRFTAERTIWWVRRPTFPVLFKTFETVAVETPAALATSRMVRAITEDAAVLTIGENETSKSIEEKKMLDNAQECVIFDKNCDDRSA